MQTSTSWLLSKPMTSNDESAAVEKSFPLLRGFTTIVLPLLIVGAIGLGYTFQQTIAGSLEQFHAQHETTSVINLLYRQIGREPEVWQRQVQGEATDIADHLREDFAGLGAKCVSVLQTDGSYILDASSSELCRRPPLDLLSNLTMTTPPVLLEDYIGPNTWTSIAAVHLPSVAGHALVAVTRKSQTMESDINRLSTPRIVVFGILIGFSLLLALWFVTRAQRSLDATFERLADTTARMERFISRGARANAHAESSGATKHDAVVMVADLRNFSGFAEAQSVEATAKLVDRFVNAATQAVEENGGDVDKFMGDGMLAWFEGVDAERRAIQASISCIEECADLPRHPGVGLYRGEVVSAAFGNGDRADFTILGRAVNLASRLCSLADGNEIAVRTGFNGISGFDLTSSVPETLTFKNHVEAMRVTRHRVISAQQPLHDCV